MNPLSPYRGTIQYIYGNWPAYLLTYLWIVSAVFLMGISLQQGWLGFIPLTLAALLITVYFFLASLWSAHQQFDPGGLRPHHMLFNMGRIHPDETIAVIDLGLRTQAIELARRLLTGQVMVIDVYNPQWTTSRALVRWRSRLPEPPDDPRLTWHVGEFGLLPLPDQSVTAVILCQVLSEFWQEGDRLRLIQEAYRILKPNGRLLLAERTRTGTNWLISGPLALQLPTDQYWRDLITKAGFHLRTERDLQGVLHCYHAEKLTPEQARQLALELPFEG